MQPRTGIMVAIGVLMLMFGVACSSDMSASSNESAPDIAGGGAGGVAPVGPEAAAAVLSLPGVGPSVIKTATLRIDLEDEDVSTALDRATTAVGSHGGYVVSSSVSGRDAGTGTLVLRVPAPRFERAMAELGRLGTITHREVSGEEVGQEFVDLQARLRSLEAQEEVLLRLMNDAGSVSDTIKVQRELGQITLEIEQIRGRLAFLEDQTEFGTITLSFLGSGSAPAGGGAIGRAWDEAGEVFLAIVSGLIVATGVLAPLAVLLLVGLLVYRWVRPRLAPSGTPGR